MKPRTPPTMTALRAGAHGTPRNITAALAPVVAGIVVGVIALATWVALPFVVKP